MATTQQITSVLAAAALVAAAAFSCTDRSTLLEGKQPRLQPTDRPTVFASFPRQSYRAGDRAALVIRAIATDVRVQIFRAGVEDAPIYANDVMLGLPVTRAVRLGRTTDSTTVTLRIGNWPSGLYFARLTADGGRIGHAPFVLRPKRLGDSRVAVVLPTLTWQAYNFSDDNDDGKEDTWYAGGSTARIGRPFENRGVPTHYKRYDQPFLRWLISTGRQVDYVAQADLNRLRNGRVLARAYDLIVYHGHHEYVTEREYDAIEQFRNLGGNLVFLSANNFFWKVTLRGNLMTRVKQWRELGRPESALIGVQYFGNDNGSHRRPWIVRNPHAAHGLMASAGLSTGSALSTAGIEVDGMTAASPRGTKVVATLAWRRGKIAHMTYYETERGAKVFAAGAFSLAREAMSPDVQRVLAELWRRLARP
jgi:N,N-dimethylformamidase beta subunit-like protein